ncbi:MAG: hypothetical protein H0W62_11575 [Chitinophagales bacterium]|nr:hypothetical protein [Chitinophagales bacterium]
MCFSKKIILLTGIFFSQYFVSAQNTGILSFKRCPVKTLNYEQGLLNNGTTNIITDALGFTWISTRTGMQRYNGYIFEKIKPVVGKDTITINYPVFFFKLKNGNIWISYKQGVLAFDPQKNCFKKIISLQNTDNLNFTLVPLKQTTAGIWCMQQKKGFVIYNMSGAAIRTFSERNIASIDAILHQQEILINSNIATNNNFIFYSAGKNRILKINTQTRQYNYINYTENILRIACTENNLYIISNPGLSCMNIEQEKITKKISIAKLINENITYTSLVCNNKDQLLISFNRHLYEFDTALNYQKEFTSLNGDPVVPVGFIRIIYADKFKRIWLLTNDDIKRIQNVDIPFEHFIYSTEKNNFIRSLYYDEQQHVLLAGLYNSGIQLYDTLGNALWQKPVVTENAKDINAIEKLTTENYLVETIGRGWYILNTRLKQIQPFPLNNLHKNEVNLHAVNFVNNLQRINDSTIFIATKSNVLSCVFKNRSIQSVQPLLPGSYNSTNEINCFIYTKNNALWVGTVKGIIYELDKNGKLKILHIPQNFQIRSFAEDAHHNIWIGTDQGLYVYSSSGELKKKFTTETGLLNDCIYALLPVENKAAVFASSNLGLSYISFNEGIKNYTKESGLQENEFNTGSAIKTSHGKFYFGGVNGITAFYPSALSQIRDTPVLNITKIVVNDSLYNSLTGVSGGDTINLNYFQNHVQLDFAALGLFNTNEYEYKYRLKEFEDGWQTTNQPTGIKYVLQPGKYLFEINCRPILSSQTVFSKTINIFISPPWWQTWWFRLAAITLSIAIIVFLVQLYNRWKYLKKIRTLQFQQGIQQERERISRDLHDNLGAYAAAIASNVSSIQFSQDRNDEQVFYQLKNNSQSIINQLNDTIWALNKEEITITAISDRFKIFLQKIQPNYPDIHIVVEEDVITDLMLSPSNALHLFRIMQEGVNNAIRHSNCLNIIIMIICGSSWKVIIKDDGKGFLHFNEKVISGNGLKNIQLRGEKAGWKIIWEDASPKGTLLMISSNNDS